MNQNIGKYIILIGLAIVVLGIVVYFFWDKLNWFGKLPGDLTFKKGNIKIYFPLLSMIILSVLLNLLLYFLRRFF